MAWYCSYIDGIAGEPDTLLEMGMGPFASKAACTDLLDFTVSHPEQGHVMKIGKPCHAATVAQEYPMFGRADGGIFIDGLLMMPMAVAVLVLAHLLRRTRSR